MPILEATFSNTFFDYSARYAKGGHTREVPAILPTKVTKEVKAISLRVFKTFFASQYLRIDIRLESGTNIPYVLEITTLPGLTETSWIPAMACKFGYEFDQLILLLLQEAISKNAIH